MKSLEIGRISARGINDVPIYASGDALSLIEEIAIAIDQSKPAAAIMASADDAAALRWAIGRIKGQRQ